MGVLRARVGGNWVDVTGPAGPAGVQGPAGPTGPQGAAAVDWTLLPGMFVQNHVRDGSLTGSNNAGANVMHMTMIGLVAGQVISTVFACTGASPAFTGPTHIQFIICDINGVMLAATVDDTGGSWPINTLKGLAIASTAAGPASSWTVPTSGAYYFGLCVTGSGGILCIFNGGTSVAVLNSNPKMGCSAGAQTLPKTFPFTAPLGAALAAQPWCAAG